MKSGGILASKKSRLGPLRLQGEGLDLVAFFRPNGVELEGKVGPRGQVLWGVGGEPGRDPCPFTKVQTFLLPWVCPPHRPSGSCTLCPGWWMKLCQEATMGDMWGVEVSVCGGEWGHTWRLAQRERRSWLKSLLPGVPLLLGIMPTYTIRAPEPWGEC